MLSIHPRAEVQHNLLTRLADARAKTGELFRMIRPEALYARPISERHRIVFYIGHLEAFDWNLLQPHLPGLKPFHPAFDRLFAFGIDPVDGGLPSDQPRDWPAIVEVQGYVARIREELDAALDSFDDQTLLNVAIEHRLMHAETLAYMFHQLPFADKVYRARPAAAPAVPVHSHMIEIPQGTATLGLSRDRAAFGWDNEYEAHPVDVPAFSVDRYKVANSQYLEFIEAGGYGDASLWSPADWKWKTENNIAHPVFWARQDGRWFWRGMFEEFPLPADWPVYVSHAEASAYARWVGKKLPTEAQWHRMASGARQNHYFESDRWDPSPVDSSAGGESLFDVVGLLGNGWEWTSTVFAPFEGFDPFPFYPG